MPIANIGQYRKSIGAYNNKQRPASDKSLRKAIRKAHRSYEAISTRSNSCNISSNESSAVRALLMLGLAASIIGTSAAISNGQLREGSASNRATFPYLGLADGRYCSSVRLNNRQLLTAKHCVSDGALPWSWVDNLRGWDLAFHRLDHPNNDVDLSILTYDSDLRGDALCIPIMRKQTQELLKNSPKNACGASGKIIVLGNGISENTKSLHSAIFDFHDKYQDHIKGVEINGNAAYTNPGDSGAAVMGCNPVSKGYELMGINSAGGEAQGERLSLAVNIAGSSEISAWIQNNTKQYSTQDSCENKLIKGEELYDSSSDYKEKYHQEECNKSKTPLDLANVIADSLLFVASAAGLATIYSCKKERKAKAALK